MTAYAREFDGVGDDGVQIAGDGHQAPLVEIVFELLVEPSTLVPRQQAATDETLERIRQLELVDRRERNLTCGGDRRIGRAGESLRHVERDEGTRIDIGVHRSSRPSMTTSAPPGATTRLPSAARRRSRGLVGRTGESRTTAFRRRVTSTVSPRSTRAITR